MAVLEKIRERTVLVLIMIGLGMFGFLFMGSDQSSIFSCNGQINTFGSVNGVAIDQSEFSAYLINVKSQYSTLPEGEQNKRAWDFLVNEKLIGSAASNLGINIMPEEIYELETGAINDDNRHDAFNNFFTGGGQVEFDLLSVESFLADFSQQRAKDKENFMQLEDGVTRERLSQKYQSLIEKGMYTTHSEAITTLNERSQNATVNYVSIPYSSETDIDVTDEEILEYYNNNIADFQNEEETRAIEYVTFIVVPSSEDDKNIKNDMIDLSNSFKDAENDESFANRYSSVSIPSFAYQSISDITDPIFSELITKEQGTVEEPYKLPNGRYRLAKLSEIVDRADSVEARHILLKKENFTPDSAKTILKDLKKQVKNGADFGQLATQFSEGPSAIKGGDLGWFSEGQMVPEFNDVCFLSVIGDLKIVTTDFGLHLIQITNVSNTSKKYKIVYFDKEVVASSETKDNYYLQASAFIQSVNAKDADTSFLSFAEGKNLLVREDVNVDNMKFNIAALQNSREIVRWMFDENTKVEDVSNSIYTCGDDYVVVSLSAIITEGNKELELVRDIIIQEIQNNKKFNSISSKLSESSSLEDAASLFNTVIDTVVGVNFASNNINGIGSEQNFVGVVNALNIGEISTIIKGDNSAYIISIVSKNSGAISKANEKQKAEIQNANSAGVFYNAVLKILKDNSDIVDNRFNYY